MVFRHCIVLIFAVVGSSLAFPSAVSLVYSDSLQITAEYVPRSYYVIHPDGVRSPTVFFREKRSLQDFIPLVRMRRSDSGSSGSGSGSYSSSGSFASSGAGSSGSGGSGSGDIHFADNLAAGLEAVKKLSGYPGGFPAGFPGGIPSGQGYGGASASYGPPPPPYGNAGGAGGYSGNAGGGGGYGGSAGGDGGYGGSAGGSGGYGNNGLSSPDLHSRFGGDEGTSYSGSAEGARGVFSASSSSIDGDGNVKYSVKTGKF